MGMARAAVRRWRRRTVRDACAMLVVLAIVAHFLAPQPVGSLRSLAFSTFAASHGEHSILHRSFGPRCLVDDLLGGESDADGDDTEAAGGWRVAAGTDGERFLMYAPQFGLGNQQITLRNAVVWAILLNRTLVLPHILGHSGCSNESLCTSTSQEMAAHSDLFVVRRIPPVRVIDMREFHRRGFRPRRLLVLGIKAVWAYRMNDGYWDQLGVTWHKRTAPLQVPLREFDGAGIRSAFGACTHHRVLAFRSLFAALELGKDGLGYPPPGIGWLNTVAMPNLYRPHPVLSHLADSIVDSMRRGHSRRAGGHSRRLACVHIRLGDILEDCIKYEAESQRDDGRAWVRSHFAKGFSCQQPMPQLVANLESLCSRAAAASGLHRASTRRPGSELAIYAAIEDSSALQQPQLEPFNISSLDSFARMRAKATSGAALPNGLVSSPSPTTPPPSPYRPCIRPRLALAHLKDGICR